MPCPGACLAVLDDELGEGVVTLRLQRDRVGRALTAVGTARDHWGCRETWGEGGGFEGGLMELLVGLLFYRKVLWGVADGDVECWMKVIKVEGGMEWLAKWAIVGHVGMSNGDCGDVGKVLWCLVNAECSTKQHEGYMRWNKDEERRVKGSAG